MPPEKKSAIEKCIKLHLQDYISKSRRLTRRIIKNNIQTLCNKLITEFDVSNDELVITHKDKIRLDVCDTVIDVVDSIDIKSEIIDVSYIKILTTYVKLTGNVTIVNNKSFSTIINTFIDSTDRELLKECAILFCILMCNKTNTEIICNFIGFTLKLHTLLLNGLIFTDILYLLNRIIQHNISHELTIIKSHYELETSIITKILYSDITENIEIFSLVWKGCYEQSLIKRQIISDNMLKRFDPVKLLTDISDDTKLDLYIRVFVKYPKLYCKLYNVSITDISMITKYLVKSCDNVINAYLYKLYCKLYYENNASFNIKNSIQIIKHMLSHYTSTDILTVDIINLFNILLRNFTLRSYEVSCIIIENIVNYINWYKINSNSNITINVIKSAQYVIKIIRDYQDHMYEHILISIMPMLIESLKNELICDQSLVIIKRFTTIYYDIDPHFFNQFFGGNRRIVQKTDLISKLLTNIEYNTFDILQLIHKLLSLYDIDVIYNIDCLYTILNDRTSEIDVKYKVIECFKYLKGEIDIPQILPSLIRLKYTVAVRIDIKNQITSMLNHLTPEQQIGQICTILPTVDVDVNPCNICAVCAICYVENSNCKLPCGHIYHGSCVITLLEKGHTLCPLCRSMIL